MGEWEVCRGELRLGHREMFGLAGAPSLARGLSMSGGTVGLALGYC